MSTCISKHGEYSEHEPNSDYVCGLCGVLDEDALIKELIEVRAERNTLKAMLEDARRVGVCGDRCGHATCHLPHGHRGWHESGAEPQPWPHLSIQPPPMRWSPTNDERRST